MREVEIIARVSPLPEELMEPVRNGDYKLTRHRGEEYVREGYMEEEVLNLLVGTACLAKAKQISQEIKKLSRKGKTPPELNLMRDNLSMWGSTIVFDNLQRLNKS